MMNRIKRELKLLIMDYPFTAELFLLFYTAIYGIVLMMPYETFALDTYGFIKNYVTEMVMGGITFAISVIGLISLRIDSKIGRIGAMVLIMIFWASLGAAFLIAAPASATGVLFLFCGISAGFIATRI